MNRRWKILIAIGVFLALVAASLTVTLRVQPGNELEAYRKLLRARGEKLELKEVLTPPVAPEDNSAAAVWDAFRMLGSGNENNLYAMQMVVPGRALVGWTQPDARGSDFTNSWDEFTAQFETKRPAIELLGQVLVRPKLDYQLDYAKGALMLLPQLAPMRRAAQVLASAAVLNLHGNAPDAAVTNILVLLGLVQRDAGDDVLISHLVRMAMMGIATAPVWELLQASNVNDNELAALQKGWEQIDLLTSAERAFLIERASSASTIQKTRASHEEFKKVFDPMGGMSSSSGGADWTDILEDATKGPRGVMAESMWRSSWSYLAELEMLQNNQVILDALRAMQTNQTQFYKSDFDAMTLRLSSFGLTNKGGTFFRALRIPDFREYFNGAGLNNSVRKTIMVETGRRVVIMAIALKRFQMKHGQWPEKLDQLAPEFLSSVPVDPYDGKPLKYHPNADGTFLLYSVGDDGVDDAGDVTPSRASYVATASWNWQRGRDWVWPQPASPAEVQNFYEHPPK